MERPTASASSHGRPPPLHPFNSVPIGAESLPIVHLQVKSSLADASTRLFQEWPSARGCDPIDVSSAAQPSEGYLQSCDVPNCRVELFMLVSRNEANFEKECQLVLLDGDMFHIWHQYQF